MTTNATEEELSAADALLKTGKKTEALRAFQDLSMRAEDNSKVMFGLALAYQLNNRFLEAIKLFERMLASGDESGAVLHNMAACNLALEQFAKAETFEERALQYEPGNYECMLLMALIEYKLEKIDEAKVLFDWCIKDRPDDGRAYMVMAELLYRQRYFHGDKSNPQQSTDYAVKAYELRPEYWTLRAPLVFDYLSRGNLGKAFMTAVRKWPIPLTPKS